MKLIGITGGIGAGKSTVLEVIEEKFNAAVYRADDIAKELMEPGTDLYARIVAEFGDEDIFLQESTPDRESVSLQGNAPIQMDAQVRESVRVQGNVLSPDSPRRFDRKKLALCIFSDDVKRQKINEMVHPAVKEYILAAVSRERAEAVHDYVFFEAALLLESGFVDICDEVWYVYADEDVRRRRLKDFRGYSDEKIDSIFASQLSDEEYRKHCRVVIDNSGDREKMEDTIRSLLA